MYDFDTGKPVIENRFTSDPIYQKQIAKWAETYKLSPVVEDKVKTKMPSASNPDPRGIMLASITDIVEDEVSGDVSIATLMAENKGGNDKDSKEKKGDNDKESKEVEEA